MNTKEEKHAKARKSFERLLSDRAGELVREYRDEMSEIDSKRETAETKLEDADYMLSMHEILHAISIGDMLGMADTCGLRDRLLSIFKGLGLCDDDFAYDMFLGGPKVLTRTSPAYTDLK